MATLREMLDVPTQVMGMHNAVGMSIQAGGPGSGRRPYKMYVTYRGTKGRDDRGGEISKHENRIAKIGAKFGGNHDYGPSGHVFSNTVYHKFSFSDGAKANQAHDAFVNAGYKSELQHKGKVLSTNNRDT